jgi:hypothetical protein
MRWFGNWAIERRDLLKRVSSTLAVTRTVAKAPVRVVASGVRAALTLFVALGISFD